VLVEYNRNSVIEKIKKLRAKGMGYRGIAETLTEQGLRTKTGGEFSSNSVYVMMRPRVRITNPDYKPIAYRKSLKPKMITLETPVDSGKAIVIIADIANLKNVLREVA
jgi:hypothetical protein